MSVRRVETARGVYRLAAFILGALGGLGILSPESLAGLVPGAAPPRWLGLVGLAAAAALLVAGRRLGAEPLPEDWQQRKETARQKGDWRKLYALWAEEAEHHRGGGRVEMEMEARRRLVELAVDRLDHGEFQAMAHLGRLRELAAGGAEVDDREREAWAEQLSELLREVGSVRRLADLLEERAERCRERKNGTTDGSNEEKDDEDEEAALRAEIVECCMELDEPERARRHLERLEDLDASHELLERDELPMTPREHG